MDQKAKTHREMISPRPRLNRDRRALREWNRVAATLAARGFLTEETFDALERYCLAWAEADRWTQSIKMCRRLGLPGRGRRARYGSLKTLRMAVADAVKWVEALNLYVFSRWAYSTVPPRLTCDGDGRVVLPPMPHLIA